MPDGFEQLLAQSRDGGAAALQELIPLVYAELRRIARSYLSRERPDHTLQTTALVHEAYLRLAGGKAQSFESRVHFLAIAARLMRQILIEHARARGTIKRGLHPQRVPLDLTIPLAIHEERSVLAVHEALLRLELVEPEQARFIEMRFFGGLTAEEIAQVSGQSVHRVRHRIRIALAWLSREVVEGPTE